MNIWNYDFSSKMFAVCVGHSPNNANKTLLGGGGGVSFWVLQMEYWW